MPAEAGIQSSVNLYNFEILNSSLCGNGGFPPFSNPLKLALKKTEIK